MTVLFKNRKRVVHLGVEGAMCTFSDSRVVATFLLDDLIDDYQFIESVAITV